MTTFDAVPDYSAALDDLRAWRFTSPRYFHGALDPAAEALRRLATSSGGIGTARFLDYALNELDLDCADDGGGARWLGGDITAPIGRTVTALFAARCLLTPVVSVARVGRSEIRINRLGDNQCLMHRGVFGFSVSAPLCWPAEGDGGPVFLIAHDPADDPGEGLMTALQPSRAAWVQWRIACAFMPATAATEG